MAPLGHHTLCMKSARQAGMSLETFVLRIQLYIPAFSYQKETFSGCYDKLCTIKWFEVTIKALIINMLMLHRL